MSTVVKKKEKWYQNFISISFLLNIFLKLFWATHIYTQRNTIPGDSWIFHGRLNSCKIMRKIIILTILFMFRKTKKIVNTIQFHFNCKMKQFSFQMKRDIYQIKCAHMTDRYIQVHINSKCNTKNHQSTLFQHKKKYIYIYSQ